MTIKVTNRDLLRNYKDLKQRLLSGELDEILIPQASGLSIKLQVVRQKTPFKQLLSRVEKKPFKNLARSEEDII